MVNFKVTKSRGRHRVEIIAATDDWVEALAAMQRTNDELLNDRYGDTYTLKIEGTHPSHDFPDPHIYNGRCSKCGAWDNGSYGSIAPCGYRFTKSLIGTIEDEISKRDD